MSDQENALILEPQNGPADACMIILHGLGASCHDFEPVAPALAQACPEAAIRFILPQAPNLPVTINGGMVMPAWYDILAMNLDREVDTTQLCASAASIQALIRQQVEAGIDSRRIILAGFSQGGAVAYEAGLSLDLPLGGLLALSTYWATQDTTTLAEANRSLKIEIQHGQMDPVVPEALAIQARDALIAKGYDINYRHYPMPHSVCPEQVQHIGQWLKTRLA